MTNVRYMVVGQRDIDWGLTCSSVGTQNIGKNTAYPPIAHGTAYYISEDRGRILEEYQLLYITRGGGELETQHIKKTKINEGDMFLIFPGEWHNYRPNKKTGWNEFWISFNGTIADSWVKAGIISVEDPILHVGVNEDIIKLYNDAIDTAKEQTAHYQKLLSGLVLHILGLAFISSARIQHINTFDNVAEIVNKAKIILYDSLKDNNPISIPQLAEHLGMSYSNFRYLFRRYTGSAPAQYLMDIRINHAKELLSLTSQPIKNIALSLGFHTQDHFSSIFKRKIGVSPSQYRESRTIK